MNRDLMGLVYDKIVHKQPPEGNMYEEPAPGDPQQWVCTDNEKKIQRLRRQK